MSLSVVTVGSLFGEQSTGGQEIVGGQITIVRRCGELAELLAACQSGLARAAVVADGTRDLTATLVDRLAAVGVAIVALTEDPPEVMRLRNIGVLPVEPHVAPSELAIRISEAVDALTGGPDARSDDWNSSLADTGASFARHSAEPADARGAAGSGKIIAVWGPIGSPGRTLVAVNMAAELVAEGQSVLLVDADSYGASVAGVLGLLDESAGLAQACRIADQGQLDEEALQRIAAPVFIKSGQLRVLTGITRPDRWTELRAPALATVLEMAKAIADIVIVDTGFSLEADEELSFDSLAPRRNAATLRVLELADTVYAVGAADPVGIPRLVRALSELEYCLPTVSPVVVLNKVRPGTVGRLPQSQLREAWERYGPSTGIEAFLPADFDACDAALLTGSVLLEAAPTSQLRLAIANVACANVQQNGRSAVPSTRAGRRLKR